MDYRACSVIQSVVTDDVDEHTDDRMGMPRHVGEGVVVEKGRDDCFWFSLPLGDVETHAHGSDLLTPW